jgi:hypothetical protein
VPADPAWETYTSSGAILRVRHTSCCGAYELASEGGQSLVLRPDGNGGYQETGRGKDVKTVAAVYAALVTQHRAAHHHRGDGDQPGHHILLGASGGQEWSARSA